MLENWNIVERNAVVTVPTLVMMGEFDTMTEECSQQVVDSIPGAVRKTRLFWLEHFDTKSYDQFPRQARDRHWKLRERGVLCRCRC
eukprot:COSAG06_NODE_8341_length_2199_cov_1.301905_4_plen_86_part_00